MTEDVDPAVAVCDAVAIETGTWAVVAEFLASFVETAFHIWRVVGAFAG